MDIPRDSKFPVIIRIFEGTNKIQRVVISNHIFSYKYNFIGQLMERVVYLE